jgi:hypothetical protein
MPYGPREDMGFKNRCKKEQGNIEAEKGKK